MTISRDKQPLHALLSVALLSLVLLFVGCLEDDETKARQAIETYRRGDLNKAYSELEALTKTQPKNATLVLYLALTARDLGKNDVALKKLEKCIELNPQNGQAHSLLGSLLRDQQKLDGAVAHHKKATELLAKSSAAWNNLGLTLATAGRFEEALKAYDQALQVSPRDPVPLYNQGELYRRLKQLPRAEQSLERALELAKDNGFILFSLAETEYALGKIAEALSHYNTIVALNPKELKPRMGRVFYQLGRAYLEDGDLDSAHRSFIQAQRAAYPKERIALFKGKIFYERRSYQKALAQFKLIPQEQWSAIPETAYYVGLCLYEQGQYEKALQSLQQALATNLPKAPILTRMGLTYLRLFDKVDPMKRAKRAQVLVNKARGLFDKALAADPSHIPAMMGRARSDYKAGKANKALNLTRRVIVLKPNHSPAHLLLGLCFYEMDKVNEAAKSIYRYVEANPKEGRVILFLAQIYMETGDLRASIEFFQKGLSLVPSDWDAHLMLSSVYSQQGKYLAAADILLGVLRKADDPKILAEARRMYELITKPFRALLFPDPARKKEKEPIVPGSLEYIKGKLEPAFKLRQAIRDGTAAASARKKLQDKIRKLIVDYTELKRKRLFLDDADRLYYKSEIRKLITFFKSRR